MPQAFFIALLASQSGQKPEWCRDLPRPAYSKLERVNVPDKWFEVYRIRPGLFAIYEPHQQEEIISYLIVGTKQALLFDTGMGISNIRKVVEGLTPLPVSVMNSHTHNDHVSDNWRFNKIYGMDTDFTREHAKGTVAAAQEEIVPGAICGELPAGFDPKTYRVKPFHITNWIRDGAKIDLGGRVLQVISTPGHTPDSISLWDAQNKLLFTGDMYYPGADLPLSSGNRSRRLRSVDQENVPARSSAAAARAQRPRGRPSRSSSRAGRHEAGPQRQDQAGQSRALVRV